MIKSPALILHYSGADSDSEDDKDMEDDFDYAMLLPLPTLVDPRHTPVINADTTLLREGGGKYSLQFFVKEQLGNDFTKRKYDDIMYSISYLLSISYLEMTVICWEFTEIFQELYWMTVHMPRCRLVTCCLTIHLCNRNLVLDSICPKSFSKRPFDLPRKKRADSSALSLSRKSEDRPAAGWPRRVSPSLTIPPAT